ncbi:mannose-1-phosphate guanylyltransferase [Lutibacter citreus]|uniref:mannose-1-phosphate guanylyltransferase n=1 Tax=Lutibacter citreus TaxID=2138210 RepID=UPI000DBE8702|nr:mannose-1-phosphate guanylyltransferase [Lutibacter citreus]
MNQITHVILTGGIGSRLWPLSRKSQPKQYLDLFENKSLFEMTVERNSGLVNNIIVVGNVDNCHLSREILQKTKTGYIDIIEATPRNTTAAIVFAALAADVNDILIVTPSDHVIEGHLAYEETIKNAVEKAKDDFIVTFGIVPTKPETGYGYIEYKDDEVLSFVEKPNLEKAQEYLKSNQFLWNSGMFCFKASVILEEIKKFTPDIYEKAKIAWNHNKNGNLDLNLSLEIPAISIDYSVMQKSSKIKVVPATFQWSDLGSFESLYEYLASKDYPIDASGNMVIGSDLYTAFVGVKNAIFVHTPSANLILQKEVSQKVKDIYNSLEKENSDLLY